MTEIKFEKSNYPVRSTPWFSNQCRPGTCFGALARLAEIINSNESIYKQTDEKLGYRFVIIADTSDRQRIAELEQQLAAMTAERDAAVKICRVSEKKCKTLEYIITCASIKCSDCPINPACDKFETECPQSMFDYVDGLARKELENE